MIEILTRILRMAQPYRLRLIMGVLFGILAGLMEPVMVATIAIVYSVVFQDATLPGSEVWWKQAPEWLQNWITSLATSPTSSGVSLLFVALIPIVFLVRGIIAYFNVYLLNWVSIRAVTDLRVRLFSHLISLPAILMRFYDPQHGAIYIGKTNIKDVATRDLRAQIARGGVYRNLHKLQFDA